MDFPEYLPYGIFVHNIDKMRKKGWAKTFYDHQGVRRVKLNKKGEIRIKHDLKEKRHLQFAYFENLFYTLRTGTFSDLEQIIVVGQAMKHHFDINFFRTLQEYSDEYGQIPSQTLKQIDINLDMPEDFLKRFDP